MKIVCTFIVGILLLIAVGAAQQPSAAQNVPKFEPQSQETFTATVNEVKDYQCPVTGKVGTHLVLKTSSGGTYEAHLAPAQFLKEYGMSFKPSDVVTVTGTKVSFDGKPAVLARLIKVRNETYMFRDDKGNPLW